jgi:phage shock protein A
MTELERVSGSTRQALAMANDAATRGDTAKAGEYNQTAEAFANRLIATEKRVEDLKMMHLQATQAAQQAKTAVQQNANALQAKLAERQKLLSQLDQAKMQQQLNTAMASISQTVDQDVPSFDDVRARIEAQYAKALGVSELSGQNMEARMLDIEQSSVNIEAQLRLESMRAQMGLPAGSQAGPQAGLAAPPTQQAIGARGQAGQVTGQLGTGGAAATVGTDSDIADAEAPQPATPTES